LCGRHGRRARHVHQQRDLAEVLARPKPPLLDLFAARQSQPYGGLASLDDVKPVADLALAKYDHIAYQRERFKLGGDLAERKGIEVTEDRNAPEQALVLQRSLHFALPL